MTTPHTILIAEDDPAIQRILTKTLTKAGYQVLAAGDGEQGRRLFLERRPDLVITDWMMPKLNGLDLCRAIRSEAGAQYTYIVLLTTKSERADLPSAFDAGADEYMVR